MWLQLSVIEVTKTDFANLGLAWLTIKIEIKKTHNYKLCKL